jgi:glycosyltransferase involved in cell wall biosynthesis
MALTDSAALLDRLIELGATPSATHLVNWGVDVRKFTPPSDRARLRARLGLRDAPVILSPRLPTSLYNVQVVVEAFEQVRCRHPDAQLVLKHIESEPPELGRPLPDGTRVVGHVRHDDLANWYRVADVTLSIPSSDSSPRTVWEAMSCGSACVLSDLPWVHELIRDGDHALVVDPTPARVGGAVERLLEDEALRASIAKRAQALVEQHRNRDREMERLEQLYESLARVS